jgi:acetate---CoA ligase (ADP-forming) subunit beta
MLTKEMNEIIAASKTAGWVMEPEAKRLFSMTGLDVPRFTWAQRLKDAVLFAEEIGYPVVAKIVSPKVIHKSEVKGVAVGIDSDEKLKEAFERFSRIEGFAGVIVEEILGGIEVIVGAKVDEQFGPVILFGMGGTAVEVYRDVALRMAPLAQKDAESMVRCLKARPLLEGYRGKEPVNLDELTRMLKIFSNLVMDLETVIESIDLNPVICTSRHCVIADARIILKQ